MIARDLLPWHEEGCGQAGLRGVSPPRSLVNHQMRVLSAELSVFHLQPLTLLRIHQIIHFANAKVVQPKRRPVAPLFLQLDPGDEVAVGILEFSLHSPRIAVGVVEPGVGFVVVHELLGFGVPLQRPAEVEANASQQTDAG